MPLNEFVACWHRIERAEDHEAVFAKAWSDFLEDEPYSSSLQISPDGSGSLWAATRYDPLPAIFALELGELLYQLRAALDGAIYAAAIRETASDPPPKARDLEFPICLSAEHFKLAEHKIAPLTGQRRLIIEKVQPYNTPPDLPPEIKVFSLNRTLDLLNDWARKDRHRALHVVGSWGSRVSPLLLIPAPAHLEFIESTGEGFIEGEREVARFMISGYIAGMNVQANPNLMLDICVDEDPPPCAANDTLGNRLKAMMILVRTVVGGIENSLI
jgi:hypothetical protein